jgi:hypothetical protein
MSMTDDEAEKMGQGLVKSFINQTFVYLKEMRTHGCSDTTISSNAVTVICVYVDEVCERLTSDGKHKLELMEIIAMGLTEGARGYEEKKNKHVLN